MRALGYNVPLLRAVAFALGALVAGLAGILSVWWNTRISPGSISLSQTIDILVIAVIGGLYRLEGAWVGAGVVAVLDNWLRGIELVGSRFNTVIGVIFLAIVLLSPGGLMGIWGSATGTLQSRFGRGTPGEESDPLPLTQERHPAGDTPIVP
jgi:branched-chain amino acid transport system permease protein